MSYRHGKTAGRLAGHARTHAHRWRSVGTGLGSCGHRCGFPDAPQQEAPRPGDKSQKWRPDELRWWRGGWSSSGWGPGRRPEHGVISLAHARTKLSAREEGGNLEVCRTCGRASPVSSCCELARARQAASSEGKHRGLRSTEAVYSKWEPISTPQEPNPLPSDLPGGGERCQPVPTGLCGGDLREPGTPSVRPLRSTQDH